MTLLEEPPSVNEPAPARADRWAGTPMDLVVLGVALMHGVAYVPGLLLPSWTPHAALLLLTLPVGLLAWLRLVRRRDLAASLLLGFVLTGVLAAVTSGAGWRSVVGGVDRHMSGLILLSLGALWALGRSLSPAGRQWMPVAVALGLGLNSVTGVLQVVARVDWGAFDSTAWNQRAFGMSGNPVFFGALMAAAAAMAVAAFRPDGAARWWLFAAAWFAGASYLSGSRVALAGLVGAVGFLLARADSRARVAVASGFVIVGTAAGWLVTRLLGSETGTIDRAAGTLGNTDRLDAWRLGFRALADRPFVGWGFGEYRSGAQQYYTADLAQSVGWDGRVQGWLDPHNVVVTMLVSVGVVGLIVLGSFAAVSARRCAGPLAIFASVVVVTWLLQPMLLVTTPFVALALGASHRPAEPAAERGGARTPVLSGVLVVVGALIGGTLLVNDARFTHAETGAQKAAVARWYPRDPYIAHFVPGAYLAEVGETKQVEPVIRWAERAARYDRSRPFYQAELAFSLALLGFEAEAIEAAREALTIDEWHLPAWSLLATLAAVTGDADLESEARARICEMVPDECPTDASD